MNNSNSIPSRCENIERFFSKHWLWGYTSTPVGYTSTPAFVPPFVSLDGGTSYDANCCIPGFVIIVTHKHLLGFYSAVNSPKLSIEL